MAGGSPLLSLAYLIEISVVLNLAYREIKYVQTGERLLKELASVEKELKKKEIDRNPNLYNPEFKFLKNIFSGKDKEAWQGHDLIRRFYRIFLLSGSSQKIVTALILYNIAFLTFITLIDHIVLSGLLTNYIWIWGYITLIISILTPLSFMWLGSKCYRYLFGTNQGKGRVRVLEKNICTRYKEWQKEQKKIVERYEVDPNSRKNLD